MTNPWETCLFGFCDAVAEEVLVANGRSYFYCTEHAKEVMDRIKRRQITSLSLLN